MSHFEKTQQQYAYLDGKHAVLRHENVDTLQTPRIMGYYRALGMELGYESHIHEFLRGVQDAINQINRYDTTKPAFSRIQWG